MGTLISKMPNAAHATPTRRSRRLAGKESGVEWAKEMKEEPVINVPAPSMACSPAPSAVRSAPNSAASDPQAADVSGCTSKDSAFRLDKYVAAAFVARLAIIAYGHWQDSTFVVKYTDIDYLVFTDAARFVSEGASPYNRSTYRYSPLLAWLLVPNVTLHPVCGKLLFALLDLLAGLLLKDTMVAQGVTHRVATRCSWVWLFNPLAINMSTRGSCESITAVLVLGTLWATIKKRHTAAALLYGASVHFRIFPIFFAPSFLLYHGPRGRNPFRAVFSWDGLKFGLTSGSCFLGLAVLCFGMYGEEFLEHSYLYHLVRQDTRHNFSVYFYYLYLQGTQGAVTDAWGVVLSLACAIPQLVVILFAAIKLAPDLPLCLFVQTFVFVIFNKVVTAQYFIWYAMLLPLLLPASSIKLMWRGLAMIAAFFGAEILWGLSAFTIEFQSKSNFLLVWAAGLVFYAMQVSLLLMVIDNQTFRPFVSTPIGHPKA